MLKNSGESGNPCIVPDLRGEAFNFSPLRFYVLWAFHIWSLLCWCRFLLWPFFEAFFFHKLMLNFVKVFFWIYWDDNIVLFYFLIFIFTLFYFTILYWFCHTSTWIHHGCTCDPKHEPPSHLSPQNINPGHPCAPAPSMLYPASDIDWRFDSYVIVYMLQCHSPKSSHPLPLPLSLKVRYTHLCLFCCLAYRVIIAIFLNSIYMC